MQLISRVAAVAFWLTVRERSALLFQVFKPGSKEARQVELCCFIDLGLLDQASRHSDLGPASSGLCNISRLSPV